MRLMIFQVHRLMLEDKPRTDAYREAIFSTTQNFKDKVVMDVGAGTGIIHSRLRRGEGIVL
jgi:predicted RNA methylase